MNKEVGVLIGHLRELGYAVDAGRSHVAGGKKIYSLPKTPSDRRWYQNAITDLKKMGVLSIDPKKAGQKKRVAVDRYTGGESPPPVSTFPTITPIRKVEAVGAHTSTFVVSLHMIERANQLFDMIRDDYGLHIREGRKTGHGSVPILAQVLVAFEKEFADGGPSIPSFTYLTRNMDDRLEMARLCANRASDLCANVHPGTIVSAISFDGLGYCESAWDWHRKQKLVFPDGRQVKMVGQGVSVTLVPSVVEVDDSFVQAMDDLENLDQNPATEWLTGLAPPIPLVSNDPTEVEHSLANGMIMVGQPLSYEILANLVEGGMKKSKAIDLAMKVAALER
jgi:hypothetical protein